MKRLAIAALLAALAVLTAGMTINRTPDKKQDKLDLKALWRDYEAAVAADRPARQAEVLSRIKELARRERLNWDFYDAGRKYVQVEASRNWKLRDSLRRVFKKEIDEVLFFSDNDVYLTPVMPGPGLCQKVQLILFFHIIHSAKSIL
jgi:hypothetical protein